MPQQNALLVALESHLQLGPVKTAQALGVAYSTYAGYKSGTRPLPHYHMLHAQAIGMLSETARESYLQGCANG